MPPVKVVCPYCGYRAVGTIEESEYGPAVSIWCEDPAYMNWPDVFPNKRGLLPFQEQKALGHVPPVVQSSTSSLLGLPDEHVFTFDCPKHGSFVLTAAALRNAAVRKHKRVPAHRR